MTQEHACPRPRFRPRARDRPLRRDAEVNLGRILVAARDVFAEQGYEASMEAIAARADVGVGTLYRRFPNKADLFDAVVDAAHRRIRADRRGVLAEVPPGEACSNSCAAASRCPAAGGRPSRHRPGARTAGPGSPDRPAAAGDPRRGARSRAPSAPMSR